MFIFLALLIVPLIEIGLFVEVGGWIGLWPTIATVIFTALIGAALLRSQSMGVLADLQRRVEAGQDPSSTLAHGALILIAGIVLLTPGFFTDAIGFLLLVPPVRSIVIAHVAARVARGAIRMRGVHVRAHATGTAGMGGGMGGGGMGGGGHPGAAGPGPTGRATVIDGEFEEVEPAPATRPSGDGEDPASGPPAETPHRP
ncbi:MAG: FxsA family protein [Pseudomonadota bacterium]